jgi:hypothetical protein
VTLKFGAGRCGRSDYAALSFAWSGVLSPAAEASACADWRLAASHGVTSIGRVGKLADSYTFEPEEFLANLRAARSAATGCLLAALTGVGR